MKKSKTRGQFRLLRFDLPLAAGICVLGGALLALGRLPAGRESLLGFLCAFFIAGAIVILHASFEPQGSSDALDRQPREMLPATRGEIFSSIILALLGGIAGWLISVEVFVVAASFSLLGFLFHLYLKPTGLLANLLVSIAAGTTIVFGGIIAGGVFGKLVWFFAGISALITLGAETARAAVGRPVDLKAGFRTQTLMLSRNAALKVSAAIFLLVVLLSSLPFLLGWLPLVYLSPFLLTDVVLLYSTSKLLDPAVEQHQRYLRWVYLSAILALVFFILVRMVR